MGYFEVHFHNICELKRGKEFQEIILENWRCFVNDCQKPSDRNKVNEASQFTMEFRDREIPFLDILIKRDISEIRMDLYHKLTDKQRYRSRSTRHPNG